MPGSQIHVIRRQNVTVQAITHDAFALKRKIELLMEELNPRLESLFDGLIQKDDWLQIERLNIEINDLAESDLERQLTDRILLNIAEQIDKIKCNLSLGDEGIDLVNQLVDGGVKKWEAFVYFLKMGFLPWWYQGETHEEFELGLHDVLDELINIDKEHTKSAILSELNLVLSASEARKRLSEQFGDDIYLKLITALAKEKGIPVGDIKQILERLKIVIGSGNRYLSNTSINIRIDKGFLTRLIQQSKSRLLALMVTSMDAHSINSSLVAEVFNSLQSAPLKMIQMHMAKDKILQNYVPKKLIDISMDSTLDNDLLAKNKVVKNILNDAVSVEKTVKMEAFLSELEQASGAIISNAGLIIIAPFLPELFKQCAALEDGIITDFNKAIALLHYAVFGNCSYREYDVLFNKILCGLEGNEPIEILEELSTEDRNEVDTMLATAVGYWEVLKGTSPDGLREGFLMRKGSLHHKNDDWFLQVEQSTIDALLQHLPWTIGFIKLPWMKTMIRTQWI